MKIEVTALGSIRKGNKIASPDSDDLTTELVNELYDPADQDWQHVLDVRGLADVGELLCEAYDGSSRWVRVDWSGAVWLLVKDDGTPYNGTRDERG